MPLLDFAALGHLTHHATLQDRRRLEANVKRPQKVISRKVRELRDNIMITKIRRSRDHSPSDRMTEHHGIM